MYAALLALAVLGTPATEANTARNDAQAAHDQAHLGIYEYMECSFQACADKRQQLDALIGNEPPGDDRNAAQEKRAQGSELQTIATAVSLTAISTFSEGNGKFGEAETLMTEAMQLEADGNQAAADQKYNAASGKFGEAYTKFVFANAYAYQAELKFNEARVKYVEGINILD